MSESIGRMTEDGTAEPYYSIFVFKTGYTTTAMAEEPRRNKRSIICSHNGDTPSSMGKHIKK